MRIDQEMTAQAVLTELGARVAAWRLERGLTQQQLAFRADIGRATLQRLESGASVQLTSLVKLLRSLGMLNVLDSLLLESAREPDAPPGRQRAPRQHRGRLTGDGSWQWVDGNWQWAQSGGAAS